MYPPVHTQAVELAKSVDIMVGRSLTEGPESPEGCAAPIHYAQNRFLDCHLRSIQTRHWVWVSLGFGQEVESALAAVM